MYLLQNYYKTSLRSMMRNPLTSFINVVGLAIAIGVCIWVYAFVRHDLMVDSHHEKKDQIYLITSEIDREGETSKFGKSPRPIGLSMAQDFSGVKAMSRVDDRNVVMKYEDKVFHERLRFVDDSFLEMFTFPMTMGESNPLTDLNSVVLSYETSQKYFGDEDPVGRQILIKFGSQQKLFTVGGVAEDFPTSHQLSFEILAHFDNLQLADEDFSAVDWTKFVRGTFLQIPNENDVASISGSLNDYIAIQNEVQKDWAINNILLENFDGLHLRTRGIRESLVYDRYYEGRVSLPFVAIILFVLACLNYINIAVVTATKRLKEIGLRKAIGAVRSKIIFQFLSENILITFFALILGFIFSITLILPWFRRLADLDINVHMMHWDLWVFLLGTLLFTGVISGLYPAFYVSKFETVQIFRGSLKFGKKNPLTKIFLGVQLVLACIGTTAAVMFTQNSNYQRERDWGYNQNSVLYIYVEDESGYQKMANDMAQVPVVEAIAGSRNHLGKSRQNVILHLPDKEFEVQKISVGDDYLDLMEIDLVQGKGFEADRASDNTSVIVNEFLVESMGWAQPLGETFRIDSVQFKVIGVARNFHFNNFYYEMAPMIFLKSEQEDYRYLSLRVEEGKEADAFVELRKSWLKNFPEEPFFGGHQEDVWSSFNVQLDIMEEYNKVLATITVILASLGLYGLITLNVTGRSKELSIRKALGAELKNLASAVGRQYLLLGLISMSIGAPVSYFLIKANIDMMFPDPRPMEMWGVVLSTVIILLVLLLVLSTQIRRVSTVNPATGLRVE